MKKKINEVRELKNRIAFLEGELARRTASMRELDSVIRELESALPGTTRYGEPATSLLERIIQLREYKRSTEGSTKPCYEENRRLWHLIRSLTGDRTLELRKRKMLGSNGTVVADGEYDSRYNPFI